MSFNGQSNNSLGEMSPSSSGINTCHSEHWEQKRSDNLPKAFLKAPYLREIFF